MLPPERICGETRYQMLTKEAQRKLMLCENAVIYLMVFIAVISIAWSICLHILSGDFFNELFGVKLAFSPRDFEHMDESAKDLYFHDLGNLINKTYANRAGLDDVDKTEQKSNATALPETTLATLAGTIAEQSTTTKKPKPRKIAHLFQISSDLNAPDLGSEEESEEVNATVVQKALFDMEKDIKFLSTMHVDIHRRHWGQSIAVQFIYNFPFLSEIVAIIWTAMCLIYQSSVKRYWGLPKPWRIVLPSILVFGLMTLGNLVYLIIANGLLKSFCGDLKENLSDPNAISCGEAILVLRPKIRPHEFPHDTFLNLFRLSYVTALMLWSLALLVMLLRYIFAVDFQVVDVATVFECKPSHTQPEEFTEVLLNSPTPVSAANTERKRPKSEDDFQSAKSQLSEVATPLL